MEFGWRPELIWPIVGACIAGGLIGFERDYRGRPAGFRTHILVALASALLMLAAVHQRDWAFALLPNERIMTDPTRMAHGVLTGVGFLCGGVIFREGFSVHGLTTAASLWVTSAIGVLFGVGFYSVGIGGTAVTLAVLAALRWIDGHLPQQRTIDLKVRYARQKALSADQLRRLLQPASHRRLNFGHRLIANGQVVEHSTVLHIRGEYDVDALASRLFGRAEVLEFEMTARED
jgi:putative Mg2+ transporter-C (MgtC) family protein